jgi:aminotransferase
MRKVLEGIGRVNKISYVHPNGAFYVFPNISRFSEDDETVAETLLREFSVAAVPGSGFGNEGKGHLRLSFSVPISEIEEGMNRLRNGLEHFDSHAQ